MNTSSKHIVFNFSRISGVTYNFISPCTEKHARKSGRLGENRTAIEEHGQQVWSTVDYGKLWSHDI